MQKVYWTAMLCEMPQCGRRRFSYSLQSMIIGNILTCRLQDVAKREWTKAHTSNVTVISVYAFHPLIASILNPSNLYSKARVTWGKFARKGF